MQLKKHIYPVMVLGCLAGCVRVEPNSGTAGLDAARKADGSDRSFSLRAPDKGADAKEAADMIFELTLPEEIARFYGKPGDDFLRLDTAAAVKESCARILKESMPELPASFFGQRDDKACWAFEGDAKNLVLHMSQESPEVVHASYLEALFAGYFEGVVGEFSEAAAVDKAKVQDLLANGKNEDVAKATQLIKTIVAQRSIFAKMALMELKQAAGSEADPIALYQKAFQHPGASLAALSEDKNIANFLLTELVAAYYGSLDENEALQDMLPKTYGIIKSWEPLLGKPWFDMP